jgi:hypothetical protein
MAEQYHGELTHDLANELARELRLPIRAFKAMPLIGWRKADESWTFPEHDAAGTIIGLMRRFRDKDREKMAMPSSSRGLSVPIGWDDKTGPLFLVEGASDVLALSLCGLAVIGRPSNTGGVTLLGEMLKGFPCDRDIIITGENDARPSKTKPGETEWPGREGAKTTAEQLAKQLGRPVLWAMPPEAIKDGRVWVVEAAAGFGEAEDYPGVGQEITQHLVTNAVRVDPPAKPAKLPEIEVGVDEHRVADEATAALAKDPDLFQRAGALVQICIEENEPEEDAIIRRAVGTPVVRELPQPLLRSRLTKCANFITIKVRGDDIERVPVHPPGWCVQDVFTRGKWPRVRQLEAVVSHPVLLPDGNILAANGYDRRSRLFAAIPVDLKISVPDRPSKGELAEAVAALNDVIVDFPFQTSAHRAAWFAGLVTPLAWFAFSGPAPMFLIDGNVRGVGKGLLADAIALPVTGRRFSTMSYTNDKEELRKKITALAVEGEKMVLMDNLAGAVGNDVLDAALTSDRWKDRLLGGNRVYDGPLHLVWFATGNNTAIEADTGRRICHIRMESPEERPELKSSFRHPDLRAHVRQHRGKLLSAALTILRAWYAAGKPTHGLPAWGSYEGWSNIVREAVVFAGLPDPGETRQAMQSSSDRDAETMTALISCIERFDPDRKGVTTAELIDAIKTKDKGKEPKDPRDTQLYGELKAAIEDLCGRLDGRTLGYRLRHFARRNFGGKMIDRKGGGHGGVTRWGVLPVTSGF